MSEASRRAASARGFKDYVKFRGEKYTRNEGRSWNRGWKAAAAYFDTAIARAVAEKDAEIELLTKLLVTNETHSTQGAIQKERNEGQVRLANAVARAVEGERAKFREYVDEMCECPLIIRNRADLRAPGEKA